MERNFRSIRSQVARLIGATSLLGSLGTACVDSDTPYDTGAGNVDEDGGVVGEDGGDDPGALLRRLGGQPGVEVVINDFISRVGGDPKINGYFLNSSVRSDRLQTCLVKQVVAVAGGEGVTYPGPGDGPDVDGCRNMRDAHRGLGISSNDFADLTGHFVESLRTNQVGPADIDTISRVLGTLAPDIIENPNDDETIYLRAGRKPAIALVISDFLDRVLADPKINGYFLNNTLNPSRLATCLIRQVCGATGGPCKYSEEVGPELFGTPCQDMISVHRNLGISTRDFNDLAGHLIDALRAQGMPQRDIDAIVSVIGPLSSQIVEDPTNDRTIYQRIGRKPVVTEVINDFVRRVIYNPKINGYFLNASLDGQRLTTCLVRQVCGATGGPCRYGQESPPELIQDIPCKTMTDAHFGLGISGQDFNDLAADLVAAFTASSAISQDDLTAVVGVVSPLASEIVEDQNGDQSIYHRVGRKPGIQLLIENFVGRVLADNTLVGFFTASDPARLGTCLVRQVCSATGGPCRYGEEVLFELFNNTPCRDMTMAHTGLTNPPGGQPGRPITKADFDALVGHLVDAMVALGVVQMDREAIGNALQPLCSMIVMGGIGC